MKKLVLAMACVLSLGLLASCKQGVQDVNLQNQEKSEKTVYVGKTTFTATKQQVNASTTAPVTYSIGDASGYTISANAKLFKSKVESDKDRDTYTSNIEKSWKLTVCYDET